MLDWEWKPTKQPARTSSTAVVTTISGGSIAAINSSKASSAIAATFRPLISQEQGVRLDPRVAQLEGRGWRAGRGADDRDRIPTPPRCDRSEERRVGKEGVSPV